MDFIDACLLISFELKWWSRSLKFVFIACAWAVFQTIFPMAISFNLYTIAFILQRSRYTTCGAITFFLLYLFGWFFFSFSCGSVSCSHDYLQFLQILKLLLAKLTYTKWFLSQFDYFCVVRLDPELVSIRARWNDWSNYFAKRWEMRKKLDAKTLKKLLPRKM